MIVFVLKLIDAHFLRLSTGWKELGPLLAAGWFEDAPKTSDKTSTSELEFWETGATDGEDRPSKSALWLFFAAEAFPVEFKAGLLRSFGGGPASEAVVPGSVTRPGFFFFKMAKMDDSRSGKGGISSSTVACSIK